MDRDRTPRVVHFLAMAAILGLGATWAHAQQGPGRGAMVQGRPAATARVYAPAVAARNYTPTYTYRLGYYGYGYYPSAAAPVTRTTVPTYRAASRPNTAGGTDVGTAHRRDWTRGWDLNLAKPWLRPTR